MYIKEPGIVPDSMKQSVHKILLLLLLKPPADLWVPLGPSYFWSWLLEGLNKLLLLGHKSRLKFDVLVYTSNPSTYKTEGSGVYKPSLSYIVISRPAWDIQEILLKQMCIPFSFLRPNKNKQEWEAGPCRRALLAYLMGSGWPQSSLLLSTHPLVLLSPGSLDTVELVPLSGS